MYVTIHVRKIVQMIYKRLKNNENVVLSKQFTRYHIIILNKNKTEIIDIFS